MARNTERNVYNETVYHATGWGFSTPQRARPSDRMKFAVVPRIAAALPAKQGLRGGLFIFPSLFAVQVRATGRAQRAKFEPPT
jgi:hypothetical protein